MKRIIRKLHIERLPARVYYRRRAPGQVVLVNGHVEFHGKGWDARKFEARIANGTVRPLVVPDGFRLLETGERIRKGDLYCKEPCALCGKPSTHVCHCGGCEDALGVDGDDPSEGRPMCDGCCKGASGSSTPEPNDMLTVSGGQKGE